VDVNDTSSVKIVELWATWCPPCKKAIPHMNSMWKKLLNEYGKDKLQLVGVTTEDDVKVAPFMKEMASDMQYPVALDVQKSLDSSYPASGIPHAYVVGKDGKIVWTGNPMSDEFEKAIRSALNADFVAPVISQPEPQKKKFEFEVEEVEDEEEVTETATEQDATMKEDEAEVID